MIATLERSRSKSKKSPSGSKTARSKSATAATKVSGRIPSKSQNLTEELCLSTLVSEKRICKSLNSSAVTAAKNKPTARAPRPVAPQRLIPPPLAYVDHPLFARKKAEAQLEQLKPLTIDSLSASPVSQATTAGALLPAFARSRLLAPDEENYLFLWMNFCRYQAEAARKKLAKSPASDAYFAQYNLWLNKSITARNQIVQANLRLVVALARKCCGSIEQLAELVSEGVMPLIRSVELFDISLGNRFSTYATWAVRNQMHRHFKKVQTWNEHTTAYIHEALEQFEDFRSPVETQPGESQEACQRELTSLLETLSDRERAVIAARFGLDGQPRGQSLSEISGRIGLSKERVRQIVLKALDKLKLYAEQKPVLVELFQA
ncbi:RNA polymerase sigma factor, sigma-70 family [Planctopirus limnophila DSM 3776]|uniref:RNA polymerase sigma factor, sigma-70 family n=1 Tax=Planctopirus limnophila (strain ATCC 43296 / DSM 3776 / IFAM 1008 / Mu 290) TaxID=521674 RepID=D5STX8_PLAL2|nr:RNA polymerase sigma factor, sigma-70 family [Planctopirus limnophila DSM 3776]